MELVDVDYHDNICYLTMYCARIRCGNIILLISKKIYFRSCKILSGPAKFLDCRTKCPVDFFTFRDDWVYYSE